MVISEMPRQKILQVTERILQYLREDRRLSQPEAQGVDHVRRDKLNSIFPTMTIKHAQVEEVWLKLLYWEKRMEKKNQFPFNSFYSALI